MAVGTLKVNFNDRRLYENLTIIVAEYEKIALGSKTREGFLSVANSPLVAMDVILQGAYDGLGGDEKKNTANPPSANVTSPQSEVSDTACDPVGGEAPTETVTSSLTVDVTEPNDLGVPSVNVSQDRVHWDTDMQEILGGSDQDALTAEAIARCIGCDFRATFDWQIQPVDLLGPISDLLGEINSALDSFESQMDPFPVLNELCNMMNGLSIVCIPDLITLLLSFKMLMAKYLQFGLEINLDWTVLIGPLLKLIVDAVASLVTSVTGVILAPLDCLEDHLEAIAELEDQARQAANMAAALGGRAADRGRQGMGTLQSIGDEHPGVTYNPIDGETVDAHVNMRDVYENDGIVSTVDRPLSETRQRREQNADNEESGNAPAASFPTGFQAESNADLPSQVSDPAFRGSPWTDKILATLKEARKYIQDLSNKIVGSAKALKTLVGGGITIQLANLGMLLHMKDQIDMVVTIIKLMQDNVGVGDWCEYIQENPELLRPAINRFAGRRFGGADGNSQRIAIRPDPANDQIALVAGPNVIGTIQTCVTDRNNSPQSDLINQWISDLNRGGN